MSGQASERRGGKGAQLARAAFDETGNVTASPAIFGTPAAARHRHPATLYPPACPPARPLHAQAVLAEHSQCPFTKQPLQWEQCKMLTKSNIHLYQDKIIR